MVLYSVVAKTIVAGRIFLLCMYKNEAGIGVKHSAMTI